MALGSSTLARSGWPHSFQLPSSKATSSPVMGSANLADPWLYKPVGSKRLPRISSKSAFQSLGRWWPHRSVPLCVGGERAAGQAHGHTWATGALSGSCPVPTDSILARGWYTVVRSRELFPLGSAAGSSPHPFLIFASASLLSNKKVGLCSPT